jgi:hypothetical protein
MSTRRSRFLARGSASTSAHQGLVASLNWPGSDVTGMTILSGALTAKRLELLRELRPQASVACLVNPSSPEAEAQLTDIREAVQPGLKAAVPQFPVRCCSKKRVSIVAP